MTETATVTRHTMVKPGAGAMKSGGAGAPAGSGDGLEGAFAAIMDMAAAGASGTAPGDATGAVKLLRLGAEPPAADATAADIKIMPAIMQAETAAVAGESEDTTGATGFPAKPRKNNARPAKDASDPSDPALLQAGLQLVANATLPAPAQPVGQPAAKQKAVLAVDADAAGGSNAKAAIVIPAAVKQATDKDKAVETPLAAAAGPRAAAPAPKAEAQNTVSVQADAAQAQAGQGDQQGAGRDGDEKGSSRLAALRASAEAESDAKSVASDPIQDILQSLPPVVQSQLGVQPVSSLGTEAVGMPAVASTGELLGNQVIDMGVSGQWIDRMAREIASLSEGTGHSRFQLMPPNLGRIQVDLWQGDDKTNVRLLTETDEAARRLREGQGALEASARLGAMSLGTVTVEKSSNNFDSPREQGQNPRQQAQSDAGNDAQQQASAQAQGQSGQGRGNTGANRGGSAAVIGLERQAEAEAVVARAPRADDPRVRFA